jgi:hypothetical protein
MHASLCAAGKTARRAIMGGTVAGFLAMVWLSQTACAADAPPRPPTTRPQTPASFPPGMPGSGATAPKGLMDKFDLPPKCIAPDGTFDQNVIVESQKGRLAVINKELSMNLRLVETPHFLIFSMVDGPTTDAYRKSCELLYSSLCDQFIIIHKERVWDGKCILVLLQDKSGLQKFSDRVDGRKITTGPESKTEAYFVWESLRPIDKMPQLAHIVLCFEGHEPRIMRDIFAHEGTHAFVAMFRRGEPLPRWLNEGLAMYMSVVNDPPLGPLLWKDLLAKSGPDSDRILFNDKATFLTQDEYPVAYTMVEYLCKLGGGRQNLRHFMIQLKEGKSEDAAMQTLYNIDRAKFAKQWRKYVAGYKPAK